MTNFNNIPEQTVYTMALQICKYNNMKGTVKQIDKMLKCFPSIDMLLVYGLERNIFKFNFDTKVLTITAN